MSGVKVTPESLATFDASVQGWFAAVRKAAEEAAVGLAHEAFEQIIQTAPQSSGDFVANTNVSVWAPEPNFEASAVPTHNSNIFQMGDTPAMDHARRKVSWPAITESLALGESIFIASNAKHDQNYSMKIENGLINLRPVNAGADHIYARARDFAQRRYSHIGRAQLETLRSRAK